MLKVKLLFLLVLVSFGAVIFRLFTIQVLNAQDVAGDYLHNKKIVAERGKILDIHHQPLAVNETKYLLYVEPKKVEKVDYLIKDLDSVLKMGEATLSAKIDPHKDWVKITSGIPKDTKELLQNMHIKGIGFQDDPERYYPEASLSAHLLGFVGKNSDGENIGYFGTEGFYDKELAGLSGFLKSERDLIGRPIFFGLQEKVDSQNGSDLVLTIDNAVQDIVKKKLMQGLDTYKAKDGCAIVADPYTMKILALTCLPDFDPEKYYEFGQESYKNAAISNLYEPGSTMKPLIMAAAIESKAIKWDDTLDETGPVTVSNYTIKTWNDKYEGKISMTRVLEKSSNVGMVYIGEKLGNYKLYDYLKKYHFGKPTDIDLQGEATGTLKLQKDWYEIDYATATFGQGIAATPLQMLTAFATVINGGNLMRPYVVNSMITNGKERVQEPRIVEHILSQKTSDILKKMLVSTIENGETKWLKPKGYVVGGKTGTAQIAIQGHYDPSKTLTSFIGFAPADKPKFIALVMLREPQASQWGSETAAPIFFDIAKELLLYYNIAPDQSN